MRVLLLFTSLLLASGLFAQTVTKLTITDNLAASSKFGYGKPKPAAAKEIFTILPDKGTQVLFYADMTPSDSLPEEFRLKFTAYKTDSDKEEWIDDWELKVKRTATYALTAINFFNEGNYKIVVTKADVPGSILASGTFTITK